MEKLIGFIIGYIIGLIITIIIIEIRERFKNWNRKEWGVPKE